MKSVSTMMLDCLDSILELSRAVLTVDRILLAKYNSRRKRIIEVIRGLKQNPQNLTWVSGLEIPVHQRSLDWEFHSKGNESERCI